MAAVGMTVEKDARFAEAVRSARLAEGAHFEAILQVHDAQSIRLQILKDDLLPAAKDAGEPVDLVLVPGDPPKLWIDLITSVVMQPDPRTYRLQQDRQSGREILFETGDAKQMADAVRRHMAHLLVARERLASSTTRAPTLTGYSTASLLLAWLSGLVLGALALMAATIYLGRMGF